LWSQAEVAAAAERIFADVGPEILALNAGAWMRL
jgi:hypothetical protein